jgi:hypothetical protein
MNASLGDVIKSLSNSETEMQVVLTPLLGPVGMILMSARDSSKQTVSLGSGF